MSTDERITIKEAAELLGVTRKVVQRMLAKGELTSQRNKLYLKGPAKIPKSDVAALLARAQQTE